MPRQAQEILLQQSTADDPEISIKLAELQNDMALQAAAHAVPMDIKLYGDQETETAMPACTNIEGKCFPLLWVNLCNNSWTK